MRKEFWFWIIDAIERRAEQAHRPLAPAQRTDLLRTIMQFTDEDYEKVSNDLTGAIEDKLILYGFDSNTAIRMSWKWSD